MSYAPIRTGQGPMTSRERVLASLRHQEPDRVPVDLGAMPSSGISAIAYHKLKAHLGMTGGHTRVYDVVQQLAQPEESILNRFGVDVLDIGRAFNVRDDDWHAVTLLDGTRVEFPAWFRPVRQPDGRFDVFDADGERIATMPVGATFFDQTVFPYLDGYPADYRDLSRAVGKVHWAALANSPYDHAAEADFWPQLRQRALSLRAAPDGSPARSSRDGNPPGRHGDFAARSSQDRALMIGAGCNLFEWGSFLRRIDNFLMDLVLDPLEVERLLDALMEQHLAFLEKVCQAVGDIADLVRIGDDLGTDAGPFMSPELYRRLFKPRHAILCRYVHEHSQMHTFLHSCGSIYRLLPDLIEAGFEVINPVQTNTRDMEPERLKKEFGADVTFWGGGCDTRSVLNRATPAQVKAHVTRNLDIFAPGGGFVFTAVHNILPDVPPENIVAMFEAVSKFNS